MIRENGGGFMNLKIGYPNGRKYLSIAHGYRDPITKKSKSKTIKSLGYLDDLKKIYPDPIAHFRQVVQEMNEKGKRIREKISVFMILLTLNGTTPYREWLEKKVCRPNSWYILLKTA
jgi:hypothetical protein